MLLRNAKESSCQQAHPEEVAVSQRERSKDVDLTSISYIEASLAMSMELRLQEIRLVVTSVFGNASNNNLFYTLQGALMCSIQIQMEQDSTGMTSSIPKLLVLFFLFCRFSQILNHPKVKDEG